MSISVIFVCHGNICRSPMAEMIFRQLTREAGLSDRFVISSAAVSYEEIGNSIYPPAAQKLKEKGIAISAHSAHRITSQEASQCDFLLIMDSSNERLLKRIIPSDQYHKIHYLMEYTDRGQVDVSDPWYSGDFETAYQDIYLGCKALIEVLAH